jgi:hypothetical protein
MKLSVVLGLGAALVIGAATQVSYRASPSEIQYSSENEYLLWFVQGSDTLGTPVKTITRETHIYKDSGQYLEVGVRLEGVSSSFQSEQEFTITRNGRVIAVGGVPVAEAQGARVDLLPRLPADGVMGPGVVWVDTVSNEHVEDYGPTKYVARRHYRAEGIVDVAGRGAWLMVSTGEMSLRQGGWEDQAEGVYWWQDVSGPVYDSVWFDPEVGTVLKKYTYMDLTGEGGFGRGQQEIRMPSGLRSLIVRTIE